MIQKIDYSDKTVVVVGGTSGINLGIAESFARCGAQVAVASRSQEKVDAAVATLSKYGDAMGFAADVRDETAVIAGLQQVANRWGAFDVVVSGAAGNFPALAKGISSNGFRAVMEIDLLGTFHVLKAAYPHLRKPGSSIINVSAPQAFLPMIAQAHVCSAKAGVDMVTRTLAMEWGPEGIRVNSVVPGPIQGTEGMKRLAPTQELITLTTHSVPLKRLGNPEDVGNLCLFLGSPLASYVSGAVIPVDGGWSLCGASDLSATLGDLMMQMASSSQ
ncbi:NAD(P)-dependent dehydrogenase (short-subunit alcohol dehydrogenase family) [Alteromonadaceae bacterium 2753L.S.0a.02]|nr:NAD(P)-dependent dehydrogenase (short-subunit alcohol dehydrogenase family) [Alteromonadaceae bacterium 2753L.S.0a.02]